MNRISTPHATNSTSHEVESKQVVYVREVTARYTGVRRVTVKIQGPSDVSAFARRIVKDNSREHFVALFLDSAHQVISYSVVSTGTANSTQIHVREVFQLAVLAGAIAIVVAHNHPSGSVEPSIEDVRVTQSLTAAGNLLGISVLDHVVFSDLGHLSLKDSGHLS